MKVLIMALLVISFGLAQSFQGSLRGRVVDPNDAAVPQVKLTLTDEATRVSRSTVSNEQGEYVFTAVGSATYTIVAELPGFKHLDRAGVVIGTQAAVTVDLKLELGQVTEQVNVTGDALVFQTVDASTGQAIDGQNITDLPLLGRNTFLTGKLAQTIVFAGNPQFTRMQDQNGNSQVSIAGGPMRTNNYMVDGLSITDTNNRAVILPSPEAVQELKVQASTYDAEVSRTGGGTFNTLLRSGTNDRHGSAVGHIRETAWLANNFFANRAGQPIAYQPFKDWAASLGGPVRIPKLYDGRNKTFFFVATGAYRQELASTTVLSVPTALERAGDFSQTFARNGKQQVIYDPLSTAPTGARTPFTNNTIPRQRTEPGWPGARLLLPAAEHGHALLPGAKLRLHRRVPKSRGPVYDQGRPRLQLVVSSLGVLRPPENV